MNNVEVDLTHIWGNGEDKKEKLMIGIAEIKQKTLCRNTNMLLFLLICAGDLWDCIRF